MCEELNNNKHLSWSPSKILRIILEMNEGKKPQQIDQRTRNLMMIHKSLHPRDDIDRLYVSRKEWIIGLASIEDNVDASIQGLKDYIK